MFSTSDTIVAIATPPGRGGIGVVRVSGPAAQTIARCLLTHTRELEPRHATLTLVRRSTDRGPEGTDEGAGGRVGQAGRVGPAGSAAPVVSGFGACEEITYNVAFFPRLSSRTARTDAIDQVVAIYFPAPASYTGEDVIELSAHGSPVVLRGIVDAAMRAGARLAEPGEFTLRAFLNGRIDLTQAEAIRDLIDAVTPLQARAAFDQLQGTLTETIGEIESSLFDLIARLEASVDFPEEGYHFVEPGALAAALDGLIARVDRLIAAGQRGRLIREGLQVAIVGKPNVGKSSVFNALVGTSRAIVTDVPGTTRDLVTELIDLEGLRVTLVDTAGLRPTADVVEAKGVERARQAQAVADLILVVLDGSAPLDEIDRAIVSEVTDNKGLIVSNKADIGSAWSDVRALPISATTLDGIPELRAAIVSALDIEPLTDRPEISNVRHIALAERARDAMARGREATGAGLSEEFVLADLQDARAAFEEISGRRTSEDLLEHIFSRFCMGK